jgi:hypothetical protein
MEPASHPRAVLSRRSITEQVRTQVEAEGGSVRWVEVSGVATPRGELGYVLATLEAEPATHATFGALPNVKAIPAGASKDTTLGSLTQGQRDTLRTWLNAAGYDDQEIAAKLPTDWTDVTLRQVFTFLISNAALTSTEDGEWVHGRKARIPAPEYLQDDTAP